MDPIVQRPNAIEWVYSDGDPATFTVDADHAGRMNLKRLATMGFQLRVYSQAATDDATAARLAVCAHFEHHPDVADADSGRAMV